MVYLAIWLGATDNKSLNSSWFPLNIKDLLPLISILSKYDNVLGLLLETVSFMFILELDEVKSNKCSDLEKSSPEELKLNEDKLLPFISTLTTQLIKL